MKDSETLSELVAAERMARAPEGAVDRGVSRLLADLALQVAPAPVAVSAAKATTLALSKWILAGFAVGLAGAGVAARAWAPPAVAPFVAARRSPPPVTEAGSNEVAHTRAAVEQLPATSVQNLGTPSPSAHRPRPPSSVASSEPARFDAELRLLTSAKAELDAGHPHLAEAWLAEHRARFPNGVFGTDRDALSVLARCAEQPDAALARAFVTRHPGSPMNERLLRACKSTASREFDK
jgi:hypothetical protein